MDRALRCWISRCGLIFVLTSVCGCASRYHEPPRSDKRTATLEAVVPVWIVSIDHKNVSSFSPFGHKKLRVTPGNHVVEVQFYDKMEMGRQRAYPLSTNNICVKFNAQPGRFYRVKAGDMDNRWQSYITDASEPLFSDPKLN